MTRPILLTLLLTCTAIISPQPASAAIVTWNFSGTVQLGPPYNFGAPITDVMPHLAHGDPFTGSVSYDTSAVSVSASPVLQYLGQPLAIHLLFNNEYPLDLATIETNDNARIQDPSSVVPGAFFDKFAPPGGTPTTFDSNLLLNKIFIMALSSNVSYPTGATTIANFDFLAPGIDSARLIVQLSGPNPMFPDFGGPQEDIFASFPIEHFSLAPEPGTLALSALGGVGLYGWSRRRRRLESRTALSSCCSSAGGCQPRRVGATSSCRAR